MQELRDLVRFQVEHSVWALRELIRHARTLPPGAIERILGIGPGSFRETIAHTLEAMIYFSENFRGRAYDAARYALVSENSGTLDGLERLVAHAGESLRGALDQALTAGVPDRVVWPGDASGFLPGVVAITQMIDHSTLHRAQCVNMLKRLGIDPAPDLDPMTYHSGRRT